MTGQMSDKSVIIIGAGIGGLTAACALASRGAQVTVLEQADRVRAYGAGIQISPNGHAVLDRLGLAPRLAAASVRAQAIRLFDYRGAAVARLNLMRRPQYPYHFVHRGDLVEFLVEAAVERGVRLRTGAQVTAVTEGARPSVTLADGSVTEADLVVGADGLHALTRGLLNTPAAPYFTGHVAWRAVAPAPEDVAPEVRVYMAPHRHMVLYPLRGGREMNIVAIEEKSQWREEGWTTEDDPLALREFFSDFDAWPRRYLERVDTVHVWGLFRHPVAPVWGRDGLVIMGDAAHPMLPFLAQGANMAIEDAWVLADVLDRGGSLADYQAARADRVTKVADAAQANARNYHLASPPVRTLAHLGLGAISRVMPNTLLSRYDWLYGHDVTRAGS